MAKKRIPSIEDAVILFKSVMERASLTDFLYVNNVLLSVSPKGYSVLLIPDTPLMAKLEEDDEFKKHLKEFDLTNPDQVPMRSTFDFADEVEKDGWIGVDIEKLYAGAVLKISLDGFSYEISFNKDLLPLKLRKAEYINIDYKVLSRPGLYLALKKRFDTKGVDNGGFVMMRIFQII